MTKPPSLVWTLVAIVFVSLAFGVWFYLPKEKLSQQENAVTSALIQDCPDAWIQNRMPSVADEPNPVPADYFIYQDVRREMAEFDLAWVEANCTLTPEQVY